MRFAETDNKQRCMRCVERGCEYSSSAPPPQRPRAPGSTCPATPYVPSTPSGLAAEVEQAAESWGGLVRDGEA